MQLQQASICDLGTWIMTSIKYILVINFNCLHQTLERFLEEKMVGNGETFRSQEKRS